MLIAVTVLIAVPYVALGVREAGDGLVRLDLFSLLFAVAFLLSLRPIRVQANTELSASDVAVLAGIILLPAGAVACMAGGARLVNDVVTRKRPLQVARNSAAVAVATGTAAAVYALLMPLAEGAVGPRAASIIASVAAAGVLVFLDIAQIVLLQRALASLGANSDMRGWVERTVRAQLLWSLAAVITVQVIVIEPWFLLPGVPLFVFGYLDIRARFAAERRARLLATLVEVGHSVGTSLDPVKVFREVFEQVRRAIDVDAFYVATAVPERDMLSFRYLYDGGEEMAPEERPMAGTLGGLAVERDQPILLHDAERDRARLGLPARRPWGNITERSIMVAPLRLHGRAIGAISAQSSRPNAYDEGDLELLSAIANEAAIAIERADLYDRTRALSRRLFDLHRIGLALATHKELPALVRALADSVQEMMQASAAAVYLDSGGDTLDFAVTTGNATSDVLTLPKNSPVIAKVLEAGAPMQIHDQDDAPKNARRLLQRFGHRSVLIQPLRVADTLVGVLFVTWRQHHVVSSEERELIGVLSGFGAAAIRSIGLYSELDDAYLTTVSTLTATIQARDFYREDHQRRLAADAVALGERVHLGPDELRDLRYASLFHSLGKIGVPAAILGKRGPLTPEEVTIVREHPLLGARILESIRFLRGVVPVVRHANERWDGTGYPDGLSGEAIPRVARILNVVIGYHAMRADRPFRPAVRSDSALAELRRLAGTWYEPAIVDQFVAMIEARGVIEAAEEEVGTSRELAILADLTPEFHTILDLQQLLDRILSILLKSMPGSRLTILLREEQSEDLVVRASAGIPLGTGVSLRVPAGRGISGWVLAQRQPQLVDDVRTDPRYVGDPEVRAEIVVPLVSAGRAIGVLCVSHRKPNAFSQRDLTLMQAVGAQIAAAIDVAELHERLKRAANTDALTGLHNFRYFYDRLEEEIARTARHEGQLGVAFFDLDKLKTVNDTYGHLAGNEVLRTLGRIIGAQVRTEDVPARYGGDEFAIVMPDTPRDEAEKVVQRLMEILEHAEVELPDGRRIRMPELSWGIASYPLDGRTARELVDNADTRAYARKRSR
ncbi:MAG TPA: GAF domain-containing protein [Candidatus Limnocylindria bacterium]|nr:GAF domain-containing protein [Candidatus Limnocylindria bacterium]